jgi:hypothetical protein
MTFAPLGHRAIGIPLLQLALAQTTLNGRSTA